MYFCFEFNIFFKRFFSWIYFLPQNSQIRQLLKPLLLMSSRDSDFKWSNIELSWTRTVVLFFFFFFFLFQFPNAKSGFCISSPENRENTNPLFVFMKVKSSSLKSLWDMVDIKRYNKNGINKARLPPWGKLAKCFSGCRIDRDTEYRPFLKPELFQLLSDWLELQKQPHDMMTLWGWILTLFSMAKEINPLQKDTCSLQLVI